MPKLTKRIVENTPISNRDVIVWDSELKGFGCKVTPAGKRVYFLYYRTKDGKQKRPKIGNHGVITCEIARTIAQQWLGEVAQGKDPAADRDEVKKQFTMTMLTERYLQEHAPHKKLSSSKEDKRLIERIILPELGGLSVSLVVRENIISLHSKLKDTPITANRVLSLLSKMFNLAEVWEYRPDASNPCRHVKKYAENKREKYLSVEEIENLRHIIAMERLIGKELPSVLYAIDLLLLTGCRLSEILKLQWQEVDLEKNCLFLSDSKVGKRTVYLSSQAIELLRIIPRELGNPYVIMGKNKGKHLVNLQKPWDRIRNKAGLSDVRLHDLRHTFASIGAAKGLSLPMIGALLGHKQTQTTARYAHLAAQPLLEAVEKIGTSIHKDK